MEPFQHAIPDFSQVRWEQVRNENGDARLMWVENGEIKEAQTNLYRCNICGEINYYPAANPKYCVFCHKKATFEPFTPAEIQELWMPYGMEPLLQPLGDIGGQINAFLSDHLYLEDYAQLEVLTRWIIASYRQDEFQFAPYLLFIGPVESGKTRALELISLLSYRGILHANISPSALCREITKYHPTICIDQAEHIFNTSNERGAEMYSIFMSGYRYDQKYVVASQDSDNDLVIRNVFGFKAMASTRVFDEAMATRSIIFYMKEGKPKIRELKEESLERARHIRNKLLYWRLCQEPLAPPTDHKKVYGRLREIYAPLSQVRSLLGWNDNELVDYILIDKRKKEQEMSETFEASILRKIKDIWENPDLEDAPPRILVKYLTEDPKDRTKIGYKLKAMNIERKHSKEGQYIDLEDPATVKQLKYLFRHFHIVDDEEEEK